MPLDPEQHATLLRIANAGPGIALGDGRQDEREAVLAEAWAVIEAKVPEIRLGEGYVMKMKRSGLKGFIRTVTFQAKQSAISDKDDPDQEFDTGHDLEDSEGLDPAAAATLTNAHAIIVEEVGKLRTATGEDGKRLFNDREIAEEIWTPLMRRKIIPENAITGADSGVAQTFDAASRQYDVRLEAFTEKVDSMEGVAKLLGVSSAVLGQAKDAANGIMGIVTAVAKPGFNLTMATDITTGIALTLGGTADIAATLIRDKGLTPKNVEAIAGKVVGIASAWVTAGFDIKVRNEAKDPKAEDLAMGKAINAALKMGLSSTVFCTKIAQGGADKTREAFTELGTIVEQSCAFVASRDLSTTATSDTERKKADAALATLGTRMKDAWIGAVQIGALAAAGGTDDPVGNATKAMQAILKAGIDEGSREYSTIRQALIAADIKTDQADADKTTPAEKARHQDDADARTKFNADFGGDPVRIVAAGTAMDADMANLFKLGRTKTRAELELLFKTELKGMKEAQALLLTINKKHEADMAALAASAEAEIAESGATIDALLAGAEAGPDDADVDAIEVLILQLKKDQAIVKMAEAISGAGAAAAAAFFPPASIAVDVVKLLIAMRKAVLHAVAWSEWADNRNDAKSWMNSTQAAAMANRAGLSKAQGIRESIKALEAGIATVGDILTTVGGPVAPSGIAVAKGAAVAGALREIITKVYDEAELKRAWSSYERARQNPEDRKAIRKAIRKNATLAKYVLAYGAVVEKDPVARNALQKCGLNAKTLRSPNTNQQKVVTYLETLYADDPVVLQRVDGAPKWHPGPVELTASSVASFSAAAVGKAKPPLAEPVSRSVTRALTAADTAQDLATKAGKAWRDAMDAAHEDDPNPAEPERKALLQALGTLVGARATVIGTLTDWAPTDGKGKPHDDAVTWRATLLRVARALHQQATNELTLFERETDDEGWTFAE